MMTVIQLALRLCGGCACRRPPSAVPLFLTGACVSPPVMWGLLVCRPLSVTPRSWLRRSDWQWRSHSGERGARHSGAGGLHLPVKGCCQHTCMWLLCTQQLRVLGDACMKLMHHTSSALAAILQCVVLHVVVGLLQDEG